MIERPILFVVVGLLFSCCASPSLLFRGSEEVTKGGMLDFARMYTKRYLRGAEYLIYKDGVGQEALWYDTTPTD